MVLNSKIKKYDQVKVGITEILLPNSCVSFVLDCVYTFYPDVRKTLSLSPKYVQIGKTEKGDILMKRLLSVRDLKVGLISEEVSSLV